MYTEGSWHSVPVILRDATVYADDSIDLYWNDGLELHGNTHLVIRDDTCVSNATRLTTDAKNYYWRSSPDGAFTAGGAPDYTKTYFEFITESHLGFADDQNNTTHSYGCADTTCINALRGQKENHVWSYSAEDNVLTEECSHCTASGTAELTAPENLSYSGTAKKAVLSKAGTLSDRELSVVYGPDELLTDGLPVNAGTYTASVTMTGADGAEAVAALTYSIEKATREPADFTFTPPEAPEYDGTAKKPAITLPEGLDPDDVTITITDAQGNEVSEPKDVGDYKVTVSVKGDANHEAVEGLTSDDWTFTIQPAVVTVSIAPIPKQLYTGKAVEPSIDVTFSGLVTGETLTEDVDYTVTYADNIHTGTASVQIEDVAGGNYMVTSDTASFTISYGVKLEGHSTATDSAVVCVDGISTSLDNGILWLDNTDARMVTTYTYHNAGAQDMHTVYPTGVFVWQLTFSEETGYTAERLAELDDIMKYAGTSIRITGNQGIRFITSVPEAKKQALTGAGLAGYQLVEYGTLMGWYRSGTDLLYGVNAKSVAYDRSSNTDSVFNRADGMVQFTGMLTNLELDQSTKDLVTRPYMVLERTNEAGETEQVVLYGGSLVRSIGYVAYQNKDVYSPGAAAYEFIWNILSYAYPDLYEAEYGK